MIDQASVMGVGINDYEGVVKIKGVHIREYKLWSHMLQRCYCKKYQMKQPTYSDCIVEPYLLSFKNFFDFIKTVDNFDSLDDSGSCYQLDKDFLIKGNKEYSRESICFIPRDINSFSNKHLSKRGDYPLGVFFSESHGKFRSLISVKGKQKHLGYFDTPMEAFLSYKEAKEIEAKKLAEKWKGRINNKVYNALLDYKVDIND